MATYDLEFATATEGNKVALAKNGFVVKDKDGKYSFKTTTVDTDKVLAKVVDGEFQVEDSSYAFNITGTGATTVTSFTLGDRADTVDKAAVLANSTWNLGGGNDTFADAVGGVTIDAGDGNDTIDAGSASTTTVTIKAGEGNDSISLGTAITSADVTLGDGKDTVALGAGGENISLGDYDYTQDVIQTAAPGTAPTSVTSDGAVSIGGAKVVLDTHTDSGFYAIHATDGNGKNDALYAWSNSNEATIDLSSSKIVASISGATNDKSDTITGTSQADTIVAGDGDVINASKGNDAIDVNSKAGVMVGVENLGAYTDTVSNALLGFDDDDTSLYVADGSVLKTAKIGDSSITLGAGRSSVAITPATALITGTKKVDLKVNVAGQVVNAELVKDTATGLDEGADYIWGTTGDNGVALENNDTVAVVDLSNSGSYGDTRYYTGITNVNGAASTNDIVLVGAADKATTLHGGKSKSTIKGAGVKGDYLVGGDGDDTFYYGAGYGSDSIVGYKDNGEDTLHFEGLTTSVTRDSNKVTLAFGTDTLTLVKAKKFADENITFTTDVDDQKTVAKVGVTAQKNTFTYDADTTLYLGGTKGDKISVKASDDANIWMQDASQGVIYSGITEVDATASTGNVIIAGTAANETLRAGAGSSSLNGGAGNDVLYGNKKGETTYWFGAGSGKDTIFSSSESDKVYLYGYDLSTLNGNAFKYGTDLTLAFTDGSSILVKDVKNGVKTFVLSDGSEWTYNTDTKKFTVKE
jgi:Ca2+-binding RTX toxin-like protein